MPNNHFQFKQFTVHQEHCAMKVGTDGVLLGAWSPIKESDQRILDVGTGTGLIALMLAQRSNAAIEAIDIEPGAVKQAAINFELSPWAKRISLSHKSLQDFAPACEKSYDFIVSNPPYFTNSLKAPEQSRSIARHNDTLPLEDFFLCADKILNKTGRICLILPVSETFQCVKLAENTGFTCSIFTEVIPKPESNPKRVLLEFSRESSPMKKNTLTIESAQRHVYSEEFTELVKAFYLNL